MKPKITHEQVGNLLMNLNALEKEFSEAKYAIITQLVDNLGKVKAAQYLDWDRKTLYNYLNKMGYFGPKKEVTFQSIGR